MLSATELQFSAAASVCCEVSLSVAEGSWSLCPPRFGESSAGCVVLQQWELSGLLLFVLQHCPVRAVLQLPWADLHHWSQCGCDDGKPQILVLMFSGSFEIRSLLDPAPREIWCPGMVGRISGANLVNFSCNSLVFSSHCIQCTGNSLVKVVFLLCQLFWFFPISAHLYPFYTFSV